MNPPDSKLNISSLQPRSCLTGKKGMAYSLIEDNDKLLILRANGEIVFTIAMKDQHFAEQLLENLNADR